MLDFGNFHKLSFEVPPKYKGSPQHFPLPFSFLSRYRQLIQTLLNGRLVIFIDEPVFALCEEDTTRCWAPSFEMSFRLP
jgi:hypothetical protein